MLVGVPSKIASVQKFNIISSVTGLPATGSANNRNSSGRPTVSNEVSVEYFRNSLVQSTRKF